MIAAWLSLIITDLSVLTVQTSISVKNASMQLRLRETPGKMKNSLIVLAIQEVNIPSGLSRIIHSLNSLNDLIIFHKFYNLNNMNSAIKEE